MSFEGSTIESKDKYEMSEKDKEVLLTAGRIDRIFKDGNVESWVAGGLAVEGYRGYITREHHDIDFITWQKNKEQVEDLLQKNGFELQKGWLGRDGKYHEFQHKIVAKIGGIETDIGFFVQDENTGEVFSPAFPKYRLPQKFLDGDDASFDLESDRKVTFSVPSKELLLALKIKSARPIDQEEANFLIQQIGDSQKVDEIKEKYMLDYEKFHQTVWGNE